MVAVRFPHFVFGILTTEFIEGPRIVNGLPYDISRYLMRTPSLCCTYRLVGITRPAP